MLKDFTEQTHLKVAKLKKDIKRIERKRFLFGLFQIVVYAVIGYNIVNHILNSNILSAFILANIYVFMHHKFIEVIVSGERCIHSTEKLIDSFLGFNKTMSDFNEVIEVNKKETPTI